MTEHNLEFLSLKGGCTGSSESTLVKMPPCWKSRQGSIMILALFQPVMTYGYVLSSTKAKKKKGVVQVTQPTLNFYPQP